MSPHAWQRLAKAIEGPSETLDRLCLWAWRRYHRAEQRQTLRETRAWRRRVTPTRAHSRPDIQVSEAQVPVSS
jgi:hypothetical protein